MCTGVEIAAVVGAVAGTAATVQSSRAQAKQSTEESNRIKLQAAAEESRLRQEGERRQGRQRVAAAKSGVTRSGSVLDIMRESGEETEREALNIKFGAKASSQARLLEAKSAKTAGALRGAGTLLTGAAQVAKTK